MCGLSDWRYSDASETTVFLAFLVLIYDVGMSVYLQMDDSSILQVSFECGRLKVVVADSLDSIANFNIFAKFKKKW